LNEEGRDLLAQELRNLGPEHDHFHLGPSGQETEVLLQKVPYRHGDEVFAWGKVLFRLDEWDAEHFPHVLGTQQGAACDDAAPEIPFEEGMKTFLVEFRRQGTAVASLFNFGWDEGDALRRALATFDEHADGDPRVDGADLEVRIGHVVSETIFPHDWVLLEEMA
jgi:hypothetical protein